MLTMEDTKSSSPTAQATEPENKLYNRSLWDPELRGSRKLLINTLVLPVVYISLLMWGCLSLYWGSTVDSNLNKLSVYAIDLDGGDFGQQMLQGINASITNPAHSLGWHFDNTVTLDAMSKHLVLNEQAWAVVQSKFPRIRPLYHWTANPRSKSQSYIQPAACPSYREYILQLAFRHHNLFGVGAKPNYSQFQGHASHPGRRKPTSCETRRRIHRNISWVPCRQCNCHTNSSSL